MLVPRDHQSHFKVTNWHGIHSGRMSDYIQRQLYLFGGYEQDEINAFLAIASSERRGVLLDIGANIGVHRIAFSKHFGQVFAFEPNPNLWADFEQMKADNSADNLTLVKCALGSENTELPFFLVDDYNLGLGTLVQEEQYDRPLKKIHDVPVRVGMEILREQGIDKVDAIKIDVQGFELEVLRGLREMLERDRPIIWMEFAEGLHDTPADQEIMRVLLQGRDLFQFVVTGKVFRRTELRRIEGMPATTGDYVLI
ncbi:FkbM family methyltransferase [Mameliella sp. CS4]|uniref:FkbM family methyltransferase n=1 Tax=Mameliella sp. CS4 TaxID=2862329 RepID=UPI002102CF08|nr:FkbM family methyltransferase [Mameliella sp. CS4]